MTAAWSPAELQQINEAKELEIASKRGDGKLRRWLPIWVVRAGDEVYVRTWHRRETGWYGHVVDSQRARVRVPGLERDVVVEDIGEHHPELRPKVDAAYLDKYGRFPESVDRMVSDDAADTTLRLVPGAHPTSV